MGCFESEFGLTWLFSTVSLSAKKMASRCSILFVLLRRTVFRCASAFMAKPMRQLIEKRVALSSVLQVTCAKCVAPSSICFKTYLSSSAVTKPLPSTSKTLKAERISSSVAGFVSCVVMSSTNSRNSMAPLPAVACTLHVKRSGLVYYYTEVSRCEIEQT